MFHSRTPKPTLLGDCISIGAGAFLPLAFAPYGYRFLAPICVALLFWQLEITQTLKRTLVRSYLFHLGLFGFGTHWIFYSLLNYGNMPIWAAGFGTLLFILTLSCYGLLIGVAFFYGRRSIEWDAVALFPACWVLTEWLRSYLLSGFPWLLLGFSQTSGSLTGYAPIIGGLGISFLVALIGASIVLILSSKSRHPTIVAGMIVGIWLVGLLLDMQPWVKFDAKPIKVSLIQGNIPFQEKWSESEAQKHLNQYATLTNSHLDSQLIVWPENAIAMPYEFAREFVSSISDLAKQHESTIISGIPIGDGNDNYRNALISIGTNLGRYTKQRLVPFAESIPMYSIVDPLLTRFNIPHAQLIQGSSDQENLRFGKYEIAPFICYEIAYSQTVLSTLPTANLLLTISDDAWFGHSIAAPQHLQIAQMRALETKRFHLFTANSGITAIISPEGTLISSAKPFTTTVISHDILMAYGSTPWIIFGDLPILLIAISLLMTAGLLQILNPHSEFASDLYN